MFYKKETKEQFQFLPSPSAQSPVQFAPHLPRETRQSKIKATVPSVSPLMLPIPPDNLTNRILPTNARIPMLVEGQALAMSVWLRLAIPGSFIEAPAWMAENRNSRMLPRILPYPPFALTRLKTRSGRHAVVLQYASIADGLKPSIRCTSSQSATKSVEDRRAARLRGACAV